MYDRAPRLLDLANRGSTEEHVGPGTYQVPFAKPRAPGKMLMASSLGPTARLQPALTS